MAGELLHHCLVLPGIGKVRGERLPPVVDGAWPNARALHDPAEALVNTLKAYLAEG
jgi:hypothetical protein